MDFLLHILTLFLLHCSLYLILESVSLKEYWHCQRINLKGIFHRVFFLLLFEYFYWLFFKFPMEDFFSTLLDVKWILCCWYFLFLCYVIHWSIVQHKVNLTLFIIFWRFFPWFFKYGDFIIIIISWWKFKIRYRFFSFSI